MATATQVKTYNLIVEAGSAIRTKNVPLANAYLHVSSNDKLADEARCLLAWYHCSEVKEPLAWDPYKKRLIFKEDDIKPEFILIKVKYVD